LTPEGSFDVHVERGTFPKLPKGGKFIYRTDPTLLLSHKDASGNHHHWLLVANWRDKIDEDLTLLVLYDRAKSLRNGSRVSAESLSGNINR